MNIFSNIISGIKNLFTSKDKKTTPTVQSTSVPATKVPTTSIIPPATKVPESKIPQVSQKTVVNTVPSSFAVSTIPTTQNFSDIVLKNLKPSPTIKIEEPNIKPDLNFVQNNVIDTSRLNTSTQIPKTTTIADLNNKINKSLQEIEQTQVNPADISLNKNVILGEQAKKVPSERWKEIVEEYDLKNKRLAIENMRQRILNATQIFDDLIKEQENEPNVIESVRQKRINYIREQAEKNLNLLKNQLDFLIDDYNTALNAAKIDLGVYEDEYKQDLLTRERMLDNTRQLIQQLITSGGIAELSDNELRELAKNSNYTFESLKSVRNAVKTGNDVKLQKALQQMELAREKFNLDIQKLNLAKERLDLQQEKQSLSKTFKNIPDPSYIPTNIFYGIIRNINAGNSYNEIKQGMIKEGINPIYLDRYYIWYYNVYKQPTGSSKYDKLLQLNPF